MLYQTEKNKLWREKVRSLSREGSQSNDKGNTVNPNPFLWKSSK